MAVQIIFNELPIKYYNSEALLQIGKSIGNVLRVDTHTTNEARGRFARLCVQINVDKPLVTAVLIGKFKQPVCYEGIQKLCFSCGRMGHRRESCPYMVRPDLTPREVETEDVRDVEPRHAISMCLSSQMQERGLARSCIGVSMKRHMKGHIVLGL